MEPGEDGRGPSSLRALGVAALAALLLLAAAVAIALAALQPIVDAAEPRIEALLGDVFGRPVEIGALSVSLGARSVTLEGFRIGPLQGADAGAGEELLTVERAQARIALRPLLQRTVRLRDVQLRGVVLRLRRDAEGRVEPILAPDQGDAAGEPAEPGPPWSVLVEHGAVEGARLAISGGRPDHAPLDLSLQRAELHGLRAADGRLGIALVEAEGGRLGDVPDAVLRARARELRLEEPFAVELEASAGEASRVSLQGQLDVTAPRFEGALAWDDLALGALPAWRGTSPLPPSLAGRSSGSLQVELTPGPVLSASGSVTLTGLSGDALAPGVERLSVASAEAAVERLAVAPGEPTRLTLTRLHLTAPDLTYRSDTAGPDAAGAAPANGADAAAAPSTGADAAGADAGAADAETGAPAPAAPTLHLEIAALQLEDGALSLRDHGVVPPVETHLGGLAVAATALRIPQATAERLEARARSDEGERVELTGSFTEGVQRLEIAIDDLALPRIRGYLGGTPLADVREGTLTVRSDVEITPETIHADSHLVINDLVLRSLGEPGLDDLLGAPLDAAILLLRDAEGSIELRPELVLERGRSNFLMLSRKVLVLALRGALNAPFTGVERLGAGVVSFATRGRARVRSLAMLPGRTTLEASAVPRVTRLAELLQAAPKLRLALRGRSGERDGDDPEARRALADARAESIRGILIETHGIAATRIELADPIEGRPGVSVELASRPGGADGSD